MTGVRLSNNSFIQTMRDILTGDAEPESLGEHWERTMDFHIYQIACRILAHPHKPARASMAAEYPPRICELIKFRMVAVHNIRLKHERMIAWQEQQQRKRRIDGERFRREELTGAHARMVARENGTPPAQVAADGWKDWV